ncbi:MAG: glycosyltransferase family 87 protein [Myxococcales bacterium]|nr:DUF2029 domain-containing protein [Myxococcales bacterium]
MKLRTIGLFAALLAAAVPAARFVARWLGMHEPELLETDYMRYVASSLIGLRFGWSRLYDPEAQRQVAHSLGDIFWMPNVYTPALSLAMTPFTVLSLNHGFFLWSLLMLASVVVAWRILAPGDAKVKALELAMFFVPYPVALGLTEGQVLPLQIAFVAISYLLLRAGRDLAAGAVLACIALKPQGLLLVPFALLAIGKRRAFLGWVAAMAVAGVAVLAAIGIDGTRAWIDRMRWASANPQALWVAWSYTLSRRFKSPIAGAVADLAAVAVTLVAARRHRRSVEIAYAAGIVGSVLSSPYLHLYDLTLLIPAAWLFLRAVPGPATVVALLVGYAAMIVAQSYTIGGRWVLLFECLWLPAMALLPARLIAHSPPGPVRGNDPECASSSP